MVNKSIITPLYAQVANELRKEILAKQYGDDGCIGTHAQLAERFSVSLRTIRAAVQLLEKEGVVDIRQGKGTFVRTAMLVDPLQELGGTSFMLSDMGVASEASVPVFQLQPVPKWIAEDVREQLGENCIFIRRIVKVKGVPVSCADMYLPGKFFSMFSKSEVEDNTVYHIYQNKLGIELGKGKQTIQAAGASGEVAASLQLPIGSPVLQIKRKAFDAQGNLIEYMILTHDADKYCFEVELELKK